MWHVKACYCSFSCNFILIMLVQSPLESLFLLGVVGDVEQSKVVNICSVVSEKIKPRFINTKL